MSETVSKTIMVNSGSETNAVSKVIEKAVRGVFDAYAIDGVVDVNVEPSEAHNKNYRLYVTFARICGPKPKSHNCKSVDYLDNKTPLSIKINAKVIDMKNPDDDDISGKVIDSIIEAIQGTG